MKNAFGRKVLVGDEKLFGGETLSHHLASDNQENVAPIMYLFLLSCSVQKHALKVSSLALFRSIFLVFAQIFQVLQKSYQKYKWGREMYHAIFFPNLIRLIKFTITYI